MSTDTTPAPTTNDTEPTTEPAFITGTISLLKMNYVYFTVPQLIEDLSFMGPSVKDIYFEGLRNDLRKLNHNLEHLEEASKVTKGQIAERKMLLEGETTEDREKWKKQIEEQEENLEVLETIIQEIVVQKASLVKFLDKNAKSTDA